MVGSGPAPLVGRDEELAVLRAAVAAAAAGEASAVLVAGVAGVGKTRLVRALRESMVPPGALVLGAQCVDLGDPGLPYLAATDLLRGVRARAEVDPGVAAALDRAPVLAGLLDPVGTVAAGATGAMGSTGSTGDGTVDESRRLRVLDATATLLADLGRVGGPVLVAVEDLQWVDSSSADVPHLPAEPAQLGAAGWSSRRCGPTGCPPAPGRAGWSASSAGCRACGGWTSSRSTRTEVAGVPRADRWRRPGQATEVAAEVFRRTRGNPYFVADPRGRRHPDRQPGRGMPRGLADLLLGRLDRLPDPVRTVVRCAAIVGCPRLRPGAAPGGWARRRPPWTRRCASPSPKGCSSRRAAATRSPHDLLRAAVHDDLLPGERARLHAARAPRWRPAPTARPRPPRSRTTSSRRMTRQGAGVVGPGGRGRDAAAGAGRGAAPPRTGPRPVADVDDAAALAGASQGRVAVRAARAAGLAGEPARAVELGRRAVGLCDADGDGAGGVQARAELVRQLVAVDATDEAVAAGRGGRAPRRGDRGRRELAALAHVVLARALVAARRPDEARPQAERALAAARAAGAPGSRWRRSRRAAFLDEIDGDREAAADAARRGAAPGPGRGRAGRGAARPLRARLAALLQR